MTMTADCGMKERNSGSVPEFLFDPNIEELTKERIWKLLPKYE